MNTTQAPPFHVPHKPQKNKKNVIVTTFCTSHKQILQCIPILLLQDVFGSDFKMSKSLLMKAFLEQLLGKMQVKSWKITWSAFCKKNHITDASSKMHFKCLWNPKILSTKVLSVILKELPNDLSSMWDLFVLVSPISTEQLCKCDVQNVVSLAGYSKIKFGIIPTNSSKIF